MNPFPALRAGAVALAATITLAGCGGGVVWDTGGPWGPAFDLVADVDGQPVRDLDLFPGDAGTLVVHVGDTVELDTSGPVEWDLVTPDGTDFPATTGGTVHTGGVALGEAAVHDGQLVLTVGADVSPLPGPTTISVYATSLDDSGQVVRLDLQVID